MDFFRRKSTSTLNCEGYYRLLGKLFRVTPPSALILGEAFLFAAAQQHLAQRGILVPKHVSLVCTAPDPTFAWCVPTIAHIRYDIRSVLRRGVCWADNLACGKDDRQQSFTKAAGYTGTYGTDFVVETSAALTGDWVPVALAPAGNVTITGNNVTYTFPSPLGAKKFAASR